MRKLHIVLLLVLSIGLMFIGCSLDAETENIALSGDLAYYANMDTDILEEKCEGNFIEVSGTVYIVYKNIGKLSIGNKSSDKIQFSCDFTNSADIANIEKGNLITVRGKCSSCLGSTIYLQNCEIGTQTNQSESESTVLTTETTSATTEPPHEHKYSAATCTEPKTCACGATEGKAKGHSWKSATCTKPKTCSVCKETTGSVAGHKYSNGKCKVCQEKDPTDPNNIKVWIPTNGGTKYHSRAGCSNMKSPKETTLAKAKNAGFEACARCH